SARAAFVPGFSPTTTKSVFFDTLEATRAPAASAAAAASSRDRPPTAHAPEAPLLRHARAPPPPGRLGRRRGLVPRQPLEAAREDDRLAGEWLPSPGLLRRLVLHPDAGRPQRLDQLSARLVGEPPLDARGASRAALPH